MKKRPLQFRLTAWFALSVIAVGMIFATVTYLHLRHELLFEQWQRVHPENPDFVLHGTYSEEEVDDIAGHILHISLLMSIPMAIVAILFGRYLARKSLHPVISINEQIQLIEATNLHARIHTPDADAELEAITRNINALLERLESSYEEIAEFSARVAHELRTPLTLMRLQLEESSSNIEPALSENLQDELHRLDCYVEQCLLMARAEQGQIDRRMELVNLPFLLEDLLEPFLLLAREAGRELVCQCPADLQVHCTPWIIRHIIHNLLSNAIKHGQGPIHVSLKVIDEETVLEIDNQANEQIANGTGLGLRIVKALIRAHGSLRFENTLKNNYFSALLLFQSKTESES